MHHTEIDDYVLDVLLPDLAGHDRSPAAFLVYLVLWKELFRSAQLRLRISLQELTAHTGLSKSAVQAALRLLRRRNLIKVSRESQTAVPQFELVRHWVRRRAKSAV
jgi:DNA-binding transcriptional ArsR family regulator